jgi:hypothetical protein
VKIVDDKRLRPDVVVEPAIEHGRSIDVDNLSCLYAGTCRHIFLGHNGEAGSAACQKQREPRGSFVSVRRRRQLRASADADTQQRIL